MIVGRGTLDGRVRFDGLETKQVSETVRDFYPGVVLGSAQAAAGLDLRNVLYVIQVVLAANGRGGGLLKDLAGGPVWLVEGTTVMWRGIALTPAAWYSCEKTANLSQRYESSMGDESPRSASPCGK